MSLPDGLPTGIEALVCADIAARQQVGIRKYGCTVAESGDDMIQHAYEEALDLAVYLKAEIENRTDWKRRAEDAEAKAKVEADIATAYHEKWAEAEAKLASTTLNDTLRLDWIDQNWNDFEGIMVRAETSCIRTTIDACIPLHPSAKP